MFKSKKKYSHNWKKVSRVIRRIAAGHCEWCHRECSNLSVHHIGTRWATGDGWKSGSSCDKHDLRRENLAALCWTCHRAADEPMRQLIQAKREQRKARREARRARHAALGIGTGLVASPASTLVILTFLLQPGEDVKSTHAIYFVTLCYENRNGRAFWHSLLLQFEWAVSAQAPQEVYPQIEAKRLNARLSVASK